MRSPPYNILHVVLDLDVGGLQTLVVDLLEHLNKAEFKPYVVCLFHGGKLVEKIRQLGFHVEVLGQPKKFNFSLVIELMRILSEQKISIIHTHNTASLINGVIAAKLTRQVPVIHTEHGRVLPEKKRLLLAEQFLSMFTYKVVAVSEDLKTYLANSVHINRAKMCVIHNGVDITQFKPASKEYSMQKRKTLGLNPDDFVIGNIARLVDIKDHESLITAFAAVKKELPRAKLMLVGDGPLKNKLVLMVRKLKLENDVNFLGEREDIAEILSAFDVFILSSKSEGISLTLLEAMACMKPIIATAVGGNKEVITHHQDGILVNPMSPQELTSAILSIANNYQNCNIMTQHAHKKVTESYNIANITHEYEHLYRQALNINFKKL